MSNCLQPRAAACATSLFEVWLQTDLQRLYDKALFEPVPDDLLRLLPPNLGSNQQQT